MKYVNGPARGKMESQFSIDQVLQELETRRSFKELTLHLQEQAEFPILDAQIVNILLTAPKSQLDSLGVSVITTLDQQLRPRTAILTSNIIGAGRIIGEAGYIAVIIEPKISITELASIINYVNVSPFGNLGTPAYSSVSEVLRMQVVHCIKLSRTCIASGYTRDYLLRDAKLMQIKGRPNLIELSSRYEFGFPKSSCYFHDLSIDIPRNRIIKSAIRKCIAYLTSTSDSLVNEAASVLFSLGDVSSVNVSMALVEEQIKLAKSDILVSTLSSCRDIIFNLTISPHLSKARYFFNYSLNMASLFQQYTNLLFKQALSAYGFSEAPNLNHSIETIASSIRLDGYFESEDRHVLLECKYKSIVSFSDITMADIYQTVAYCTFSSLRPSVAFIAYPKSLNDSTITIIAKVTEFELPRDGLYLLCLPLTVPPSLLLAKLKTLLKQLFMPQ